MTDSQTPTQQPDQALLEMTRWFLLSVLRHLRQEDWQELSASGFSEQQQVELAERFLNDKSVRQSVRMVLREPSLRNRLVGFGGNRDVASLVLSDSTQAFKQAVEFWEKGLAPGQNPPQSSAKTVGAIGETSREDRVESARAAAVIPNRRAARRARPIADNTSTTPPAISSAAASGHVMSEEEYQQLEQALASGPPRDVERSWVYRNNEDRISLLAGLLAGVLFFALVLWLFL